MLFATALADGVVGPDWTGRQFTYQNGQQRLIKESQRGYYEQVPQLFSLANNFRLGSATSTQGGESQETTSAAAPEFRPVENNGRTIVAADLGKLIRFSAPSNAVFSIPNDAALGITNANSNIAFEIYQVSTGVPSVQALSGSGVTLRVWSGYPTSAQFVTQTIHRVGPNEWAVK